MVVVICLISWCLGLGGLGGDEGCKLTGEMLCVSSLLSHPATLVTAIFLACVHTATGLDLLSAFGLLITIVAFVSVLLH